MQQYPAYACAPLERNPNFQACLSVLNAELTAIFDDLQNLNAGYLLDKDGLELDFYAAGIYGIYRPTVGLGTYLGASGALGQRRFATRFCSYSAGYVPPSKLLSDDEFKRFLVWQLSIGDGRQFNITWLKRNIARFLLSSVFDEISATHLWLVGIVAQTKGVLEITLPYTTSDTATQGLMTTLKWLIQADLMNLPIQYTYKVNLA